MLKIPPDDIFRIENCELSASEVIELLAPQITDRRRSLIERVVNQRTCTVVPVMDGIYDTGNIAAVLRSTEALGYQCAHIIESQDGYKTSRRITQGADKWLDVKRWSTPTQCAHFLKEQGYQICATHLDAAQPLSEIDFTVPTAIVFGNERDGVSEELLQLADKRCIIPMAGFVQSFNISVAAAISLYHIYQHRVNALGEHGDLSEEQKRVLTAEFYLRAVHQPQRLIPRLLTRQVNASE